MTSITSSELHFIVDELDIEEGLRRITPLTPNDRISGAYLGKDPIAVALEKIGKYSMVLVGWLSITAYKGPKIHDFQILNYEEIERFLLAFDRFKHIDPIEVRLFLQAERSRTYGGSKTAPKKERVVLTKGGELIP